jgi:hypothetical protein
VSINGSAAIGGFRRDAFTFDRLAVALLFLAMLATACVMPAQNDTWWHLRVGQEIWKLRWPLFTDTFSFTASGAPWRNHEWLTQLGFYVLYSLGGMPLLTFAGALLIAAAWVLSWHLMAGPTKLRVLLIAVALPAFATAWSLRPHLITLALLPLVMLCLLRNKLWWLPAVFFLWANLHGGFMLGLAVVAVSFTAIILKDRTRWRALSLIFAVSATATLINPLGVTLWTVVFESIGRGTSIGITEFHHAELLAPEDIPFWLFSILLAGLSVGRAKQLWPSASWPMVATALVLIPSSLRYGRNIPLFLLLAVPAVTHLLMMKRSTPEPAHIARREHVSLNLLFAAACSLVAIVGVGYAWNTPIARLQWEPLPAGAISAVERCPERLYNRYDDGGFLLWFVPSKHVFVDSRQDPYPIEFLQEHLRSENSGDYTAVFARYGIHCALLPPASPVARNLQRDRWQPVYQDSRWMVLRD